MQANSTATAGAARTLGHFVAGRWTDAATATMQDVRNPATGALVGRVPLGGAPEVAAAVAAAKAAYPEWRATPPMQRARYLFALKALLEENFEAFARIVTSEHGKTLRRHVAVRRGIDNAERATGIPSLLMGDALEDVGRDIDCEAVRQRAGVFAAVCPFNFRPWCRCGSAVRGRPRHACARRRAGAALSGFPVRPA
jgi:malonate-semialdehyde dehydrogenase (acetylating)/methylmalonate-semialdehyde dehydrogenase